MYQDFTDMRSSNDIANLGLNDGIVFEWPSRECLAKEKKGKREMARWKKKVLTLTAFGVWLCVPNSKRSLYLYGR